MNDLFCEIFLSIIKQVQFVTQKHLFHKIPQHGHKKIYYYLKYLRPKTNESILDLSWDCWKGIQTPLYHQHGPNVINFLYSKDS